MGQPVKARPRIWFRIAQIFRPARPEPACLDEVAALRSEGYSLANQNFVAPGQNSHSKL